MSTKHKLALQELLAGFKDWRIWLIFGWQDIKLRYRRSQLGPFWLTLSMAITTYSMGFLYGNLFKLDLHNYFPFLASGMIAWGLIVTMINESTNALIEAGGYIKQIKLSPLVFVLKVITRNVIIFFHNIVAVLPIIIFFHIPVGWHIMFLFTGLMVIIANGICYGMLLSMLGARFRDIAQVVVSAMQIVFFMTPVMWMPKNLPEKYQLIVNLNPFAHFVNLIRAPLTGVMPDPYDYVITIGLAMIGLLLMFILYSRSRHRIVYWM